MQQQRRMHPRESVSERQAPASAVRLADAPSPAGRLLGNGRLCALLSVAGTGGSWLGSHALSRWRGDRVEDTDGWFVYLRDLDDGTFWSAGLRPVPDRVDRYQVGGGPGSMSILRETQGIESRLEAWVDTDAPAECRRLNLHNRSARLRWIEVTSYLEVVLHHPQADAAHPAFSGLFVETESVPARGMVLAHRRARDPRESHPCLAQSIGGTGALELETDRARFLGRGRDLAAPAALVDATPLPGATGAVLDPVFALRRRLSLGPGERATVELLLAAEERREQALAWLTELGDPAALERSHARADAEARRRHVRLGLDERQAAYFESLGVALRYGDPRLRPGLEALGHVSGGRDTLQGLGLEPGIPLVLIEPGASREVVHQMLTAHRLWRELGFTTCVALSASHRSEAPESAVGLHALPPDALGDGRLDWLRLIAQLVVGSEMPDLETRLSSGAAAIPPAPPPALESGDGAAGITPEEELRSFNGYGGFSEDGSEYVIRLPRSTPDGLRLPPRPWVNVLANPSFGTLVSETGAGFTWSDNSRELRLTPWSNDPVRDPHDEALYLRDETTGEFWSPLPGPAPGPGEYEMRHGFGYSRCRHRSGRLETDTHLWVPQDQPVKIVQVRISNHDHSSRRLSFFAYQRLVLGGLPEPSSRTVVTALDRDLGILLARQQASDDFGHGVAFAAAVTDGRVSIHLTADRETFLGRGGGPRAPLALRTGAPLEPRAGSGLDPCFALQLELEIGPGETRTCGFVLGRVPDTAAARALVGRLRAPGALEASLQETRGWWKSLLARARIETPVESLDRAFNGWVPYQALACRLWGRSAFYQSGGAFGFRDQLQDAGAFVVTEPKLARDQILLHAAHQFVEGDVLHWWHPPSGRGIRTRFVDDRLWLPQATVQYLEATGDDSLLDETVGFRWARALEPGEDEAFLLPEAAEPGSIYEHCCRALDGSLGVGAHGLPLFGSGDWNDGMNRVGRGGRGESVWMAFFLFSVLAGFVPLCEARGHRGRAARYREHQQRLRAAIESAAWDGEWYRRGYYDDGTPLGSRVNDECQIDALAQAWAVLSGAADSDRARRAMEAVDARLVSDRDRMVRLLAPPFDTGTHDPGYIKGYVRGVRENGGQYTHAALWVAQAMIELGWRDRAAQVLEMLSPGTHARNRGEVAVYQVEPYVVAADVYGEPPHVGRGGWTWYTGSAGWMFRVVLESLLGIRIERGRTLVVRPAIPDSWPGFRARLNPGRGEASYEIEVRNPKGRAGQVVEALIDGTVAPVREGAARIPLVRQGVHQVVVVLGSEARERHEIRPVPDTKG
ncbi:MAG TPA: glycosyl transferase [Candidatus Eisenbacteria bacterium]|jgi:cyclic beta-1,2-glucan synthetase